MKKITLALSSKVLAVLGMVIAAYMTIYKWTANDGMCLGSGDCSTVNASPYSAVYGVPVALVGLIGYLVLFLLFQFEDKHPILREYGFIAIFGIALVGFLFTIYLVYLEFWVIHALCPFCLASQATMTILFALACARLVKQL